MPGQSVWIVVAGVLILMAFVGRIRVDSVKRRRQIDALMERLEELETRLAVGDGDTENGEFCESGAATTSGIYSGDVLAGQSSYVARLVSQVVRPTDLAGKAVVAVYRRIEEPIRPSDLADELCVSLRSLQRGLAEALDCTPHQLILTIKMREARRLMASGELQVSEVAHRLAFFDSSHLARSYRKFYRCAPSHHKGEASVSARPN